MPGTMFKPDKRAAVLTLAIFFSVCVSATLIVDPDLWWHMNYGRYILHSGFPGQDPFTLTHAGRPFMHFYLAQILLYLIYSLAGAWGLFLLKIAVCTGVFLILKKYAGIGIASFGIILLFLSMRLFARPELFAFILFSLAFPIFAIKDLKRRLIALFLCALLWNQIHPSVAILLLFPFCAFISGLVGKRPEFPARLAESAVIAAAFLINPTSVLNLKEYANILIRNNPAASIGEWQPFFSPENPVSLLYKLAFIFTAVLCISDLILKRRTEGPFWPMPFFLGVLTLFSRRFTGFWGLSLAVFLEGLLTPHAVRKKALTAVLFILFTALLIKPTLRMPLERGIGISTFYDMKIRTLFSELRLDGRILSDYDIGGFVSFILGKEVFIYGNNLNEKEFAEYRTLAMGKGIPDFMDKYSIDIVIMKPFPLYPGGRELYAYFRSGGWEYLGHRTRYQIWKRTRS